MGQIDKTRDNIKVESLNNEERKDLFKKLVKSGGQILYDKPKPVIRIDREKQKDLKRRLDSRKKSLKSAGQLPSSFSRTGQTQSQDKSVRTNTGFSIFWTKIQLFFSGVSDLGGFYFKNKFLEKFKTEFNPSLMELQMLFLDLFKQNPNQGLKIIEELDKLRPLYFELLQMSSEIYDISIASRLLDSYTALPGMRFSIKEYKSVVLEYFKRLYPLYRFVDTINFAYNKSVDLQQDLEHGKHSTYTLKRKKAQNSLYIIFNKFFPKLHRLSCLIKGEFLDLSDVRRIDEIFGILQGMHPGTRIPNQEPAQIIKETELNPNPEEIVIESDHSAEEQSIPQEVTDGLILMSKADLNSLRAEVNKDETLKTVSENDKLMVSYLLFTEFDREFAFILTTYKMKFNPAYSIRGKSDYRLRLSELYDMMKPCYDSIKEYFMSLDLYEKARVDRPSTHDHYFQYTKRLTELDREKKTKARASKAMLQNYMGKVIEEMRILLTDIGEKHEIIQNPFDVLEFDSSVDFNLKMKDSKISDVLLAAYSFASAYYYRLSPGGDLYGEQSLVIEEKSQTAEVSSSKESVPKKTDSTAKTNDNKGKKDGDSILGELDDLL